MEKTIYNPKFDNIAIVYGAPKTGKTRLAINIARDIIAAGKDIIWINNEMQPKKLAADIYKDFTLRDNIGNAFIFTVSEEWLEKENVVKYFDNIFKEGSVKKDNIALVIIDTITFTDYDKCCTSYEKLLHYFKDTNIGILGVMQRPLELAITMPLKDACHCYAIDSEGNTLYKDFKLIHFKDWSEFEDLFIEEK